MARYQVSFSVVLPSESDSESDSDPDTDDLPLPPAQCEFNLPVLSELEEACVFVIRSGPGIFRWREVFGWGNQPLARHFRWMEYQDLLRDYDARKAEARRVREATRPVSSLEQRVLQWAK